VKPKVLATAIVTAIAPLILTFSAFVANEAQMLLDLHLDQGALAAYISVFSIAVLVAVIRVLEHVSGKWLKDAIGALGAAGAFPVPPPRAVPATAPPAAPGPPPPGPPPVQQQVPPTPPTP
jgi:hypothetical protein